MLIESFGSNEQYQRPLCNQYGYRLEIGHTSENLSILSYTNCACLAFLMNHVDSVCVPGTNGWPSEERKKLSVLLGEWHAAQKGTNLRPLLWFDRQVSIPAISNSIPVLATELLESYPSTVSARIKRSFLHLARTEIDSIAGRTIERPQVLFAKDNTEAAYLLDAIEENGWIKILSRSSGGTSAKITPKSWAVFQEFEETSSFENPVFVAMWFGGDKLEDQKRQDKVFAQVQDTCKRIGWGAERSNSPEHNDSIIDKIIYMIRRAPFVIADLSDENHCAYYEAGFAKGLGREVIYLVKEGTRVHFDLSGMNQVRWGSIEELRTKLENRILGTKGRGPHKLEEQK